MQATVTASAGDKVFFYWKVSSQSGGDYLQFYIDSTLKAQISGEVDWEPNSYTVPSGTHILKWRYVKNSSTSSGSDCGWVDFVQWSGPSPEQDTSNWQDIAYKHDVTGRRVEKKVDGYSTRYVHDGDHIIAEYDGNNNLLRKYIYGPGIDQPVSMIEVADANATYYYHFDALGSVVALSNAAGDTVQTYEYSVYGEVAVEDANHTNPYMFAGVRFDRETGLYYNRARYYHPFTGRFLQTDPIGYGAGMNLYAYGTNNPVRNVDPSGLNPVSDKDFQFLYDLATTVAELARKDPTRISDVAGLALIADVVAIYTGSEPNDVDDFIGVFSRLLSAWLWDPKPYNPFNVINNTHFVSRFGDNGFKEEYQEPRGPNFDPNQMGGRNQVTHFVGYVTAGYYGPEVVANAYLYYREVTVQGQTTDSADYKLGKVGIDVGVCLRRYRDQNEFGSAASLHLPCPLCGSGACKGLAPNQVGNWIRSNLAK